MVYPLKTEKMFKTRYLAHIHVIMFSVLLGGDMVQIKLSNEQEIQGEFIGTYMNHIHILKTKNYTITAAIKSLRFHHLKKVLATTAIKIR